MNSFGDKKPDIDYPCSWTFKVIGTDEQQIKKAVEDCVSNSYTLKPSKVSNKGKYISLNLIAEVASETHRNEIYTSLSENEYIKMVI